MIKYKEKQIKILKQAQFKTFKKAMVLYGELSAMIASFNYAASSNLYSLGSIKQTSPFLLNLSKGIVSGLIMFILLITFSNNVFPNDTMSNYILLIASGIFGIGIGDSFYFKALTILGARQTILMEILAPPFTGIISYFYYGTTLSLLGWIGIMITAYGVYIVVNEQQDEGQDQQQQINNDIEMPTLSPTISTRSINENKIPEINQQFIVKEDQECQNEQKNKLIGIINGIFFTFCQSMGMVLSHDAATTSTFTSLQCSLLRMLAGVVIVLIIMMFKKERIYWPCKQQKETLFFLTGIAIGPFLGIWAQQTSLLFTRPEISQTIIATSPLFGILISWIRGEEIKAKYIIGSLISIFGVSIIIWI